MLSIIEFELTEDGPYGNVGGSPWTDVNTFMANGPLTAIEIRAGGAIDGLRARYSKVQYCNFFFLLSTWVLQPDFKNIFYLRYNNTWGDWHGGTGGSLFSFESMVIGANGVETYGNSQVDGLVFRGKDGTNYGPYGGTSGTYWETSIPSGCSVQYISGRTGLLLDAISFHYSCSTPAGMNIT